VSSLIDHNSKTWNQEVIHKVFIPDITMSILCTPLIVKVEEDKLIWKVEKNGGIR